MNERTERKRGSGISILFTNPSGGVDRITCSSNREAQQIIREREKLGETPIASSADHEAIELTEIYRLLGSSKF